MAQLTRAELEAKAIEMANAYNLPSDLFLKLVQAESSWNPNARSRVGAIGLTQVMPATAKGMGYNPAQLAKDPVMQLEAGAKHLSYLSKLYKGDQYKMLWAYNAGQGRVRDGVMPDETRTYISNILGSRAHGDRFTQQRLASRGGTSRSSIEPLARQTMPASPTIDFPRVYQPEMNASRTALLDALFNRDSNRMIGSLTFERPLTQFAEPEEPQSSVLDFIRRILWR